MSEVIAKIYNVEGKVVGEEKLPAQIFAVPVKPEVIQQVVVAQRANARQTLAHTKTRGEVRGGGRKPWKQKGTGRARHGSTRSPIWVGGGVTFGPRKEQTYTKSVNKKMKQKALRMVLSDKAANERLLLIDQMTLSAPKTKVLHSLLQALPSKGKKMLLVTEPQATDVIRAARNLARTATIGVGSLNVLDILNYEYLIMPQSLISKLSKAV